MKRLVSRTMCISVQSIRIKNWGSGFQIFLISTIGDRINETSVPMVQKNSKHKKKLAADKKKLGFKRSPPIQISNISRNCS